MLVNPFGILKNVLPIVQFTNEYNTDKALADLVAGITVGLTLIPQSLAYASLAGLDPQVSLEVSRVISFAMIKFQEEISIHDLKAIKRIKDKAIVKCKGASYEGEFLGTHCDRSLLEKISRNLNMNLPRVVLRNCDNTVLLRNNDNIDLDISSLYYMPTNDNKCENDDGVSPGHSSDHIEESDYNVEDDSESEESDILHDGSYEDDVQVTNRCGNIKRTKGPSYVLCDNDTDEHTIQDIVLRGNKTQTEQFVLLEHSEELQTNQIGNMKGYKKLDSLPAKKNSCPYCKKLVSKLPRHLECKHKSEPDVRPLLTLPKGSEKRKILLEKLRKRGNFLYGAAAIQSGQGEVISVRRSILKKRGSDHYIPCPYCKGFYSRLNLRNHIRLNCAQPTGMSSRSNITKSARLLGNVHEKANYIVKEHIFPVLRNDDVSSIIRHDELVVLYANQMAEKYRRAHQHDMIRARLRTIGRFLIAIKEKNPSVSDAASIFRPELFDDVIFAINKVAGLDVKSGQYKSPFTAFSIGSLLTQMGEVFVIECIKNSKELAENTTKKFLFLLRNGLQTHVNKTVTENMTERKRQKKVILPETESINKLFEYLIKEMNYYVEKLKVCFDISSWTILVKATLAAILIFNRRRPGELERTHLYDYKNLSIIDTVTKNKLVGESRHLANTYARYEIRGKLNRTVAVLISQDMKLGIDTILQFRRNVQIPDSNMFVFAKPSDGLMKHFSANECLNYFKNTSNIPGILNLTATNLRKHLATVSNNLQLNDRELTTVQEFMGHEENIHKNIYRQLPVTRDVLQMGKVLTEAVGATLVSAPEREVRSMEVETCSNEELDSNGHEEIASPTSIHTGLLPEREVRSTEELNFNEYEETASPTSTRTRVLGLTSTSIVRRTWKTPERKVVRQLFKSHIQKNEEPSINECEIAIFQNEELKTRTSKQLQMWISHQIKLRSTRKIPAAGRKVNIWTTPEKKACRNYFKKCYELRKYPSVAMCRRAVAEVPLLKCRSPRRIRSHIQHEFKKIY